ncbi:MAG: serine/threonine protein kinase [Planctomycetes bacterium]|nr:serine/threonine protein kinase [Planctomycetota bacterium]
MKPGELVAGYRVGASLGAGGMGAVYRAEQMATGRLVALKAPHLGANPDDLARFEREGRAMARLSHPNLLRVHTVIQSESAPLLVLEFAPGGSLAERLRTGPVSESEALEWIGALASGLATAHGAGVLHRDIKPQNVLFGDEGRPKLADFGLAKAGGDSRLTETHALLGTPLYMAPEQARGEPASPKVDVYSLGAVLYHCLTGRPPLLQRATLLSLLHRLQDEAPPSFASLGVEVSPGLESLCSACLAKDPRQRPSAAEVAESIRAGSWRAEPKRSPLARWLGLSLATVLATLLVGGGLLLAFPLAPATPATPATPAKTPSATTTQPRSSQAPLGWPIVFSPAPLTSAALASAEPAVKKAAAGLSRVQSSSLSVLYDLADNTHIGDPRGLSAALELARRGHTYGLIRLALHATVVDHDQPLSRLTRKWLHNTAQRGDSWGLLELGHPNEIRHGDKEIAQAYRHLGIVTRPLYKAAWLRESIRLDGYLKDYKPPTQVEAWKKVWHRDHDAINRAARGARAKLLDDPSAAVEDYLELLAAEPDAARRTLLAEELTRAAELAWLPLVTEETRLLELSSVQTSTRVSPTPADLRQASRVLGRVRWPRGLLLELELRLRFAKARDRWKPGEDPPEWVQRTLGEAHRLRPGSALVNFARYKAWMHDTKRALQIAEECCRLARSNVIRSQLEEMLGGRLLQALHRGAAEVNSTRVTLQQIPGSHSAWGHYRRLVVEHVALQRGLTDLSRVMALREDFKERIVSWDPGKISSKQRGNVLATLEKLAIRPPPKAAPSPTPSPR